MASLAGGYTTTEAVRAAIGVTDNEFSDTDITSRLVDLELLSDLDLWLSTHATIKSEGEGATPTAEQTAKWRNLQIYCMYFGGYLLLDTGGLGLPQVISDGKSEIRRKQKMDESAIKDACLARARIYKERLGGTDTTVTAITLAVAATPDYDPVTHT